MTTDNPCPDALPGELLIEELDHLRRRLATSGVDRTLGLKKAMGRDCEYYMKSLNGFLVKDYRQLRDLVYNLNKLFMEVEKELDE